MSSIFLAHSSGTSILSDGWRMPKLVCARYKTPQVFPACVSSRHPSTELNAATSHKWRRSPPFFGTLRAREGLQGILESRTVALTAASLPVRTIAGGGRTNTPDQGLVWQKPPASPDLVLAKGALRHFPGNAAGRESVCGSGWGDHECKTQERRTKKQQTSLEQERCVGVGKANQTSARCA